MPAVASFPRKILVTGVAGFIGSRVCALLHAQGCEVTGLDIFNDAYDVRLKDWRWAQLKPLPGLELQRLDLVDKPGLANLFKSHAERRAGAPPFDAVVNLAARAGVRASVENPSVYVETNITGGLNLLELCRHHGVKKFVLASTSSLYGQGLPAPYREDLNTDHPLSPYAATKKAAEAMAYSYHYLHRARRQHAALFYRLWASRPAGHGAAAVRAAHSRRSADHSFRRRVAVARFYLRRRYREGNDRGAAPGGLRGVQPGFG